MYQPGLGLSRVYGQRKSGFSTVNCLWTAPGNKNLFPPETKNWPPEIEKLDRWFNFLIINILCFHDGSSRPCLYNRMKKQIFLTVPVEQITWEGLDVPVSLDADWFAHWLNEQPGLDFSLEKPITGTIHLERHEDNILVRGHLWGDLSFTCSRCLEAFAGPLAADFDILLKIGRPPAPDQEIELNSGDLDEEYVPGDEFDVNDLVREQIILALPLKPLCREECLGLCRQCGANLNREPCSCAAPAFNPSFAVLEKLKK